jgi:hypothetical protein
MRRGLFLLPVLLAGCGQSVPADGPSGNGQAREERPADPTLPSAVPVRVGELGPSFAACPAAGTTRHLAAGTTLAVRAAPYENGAEAGAIAAGSRFFVCTRSMDQKWLGIVFHDSGGLDASCGVSSPLPRRRAYEGPCRAGWVSSASVRLIAGLDQPSPPNQVDAGAGAEG